MMTEDSATARPAEAAAAHHYDVTMMATMATGGQGTRTSHETRSRVIENTWDVTPRLIQTQTTTARAVKNRNIFLPCNKTSNFVRYTVMGGCQGMTYGRAWGVAAAVRCRREDARHVTLTLSGGPSPPRHSSSAGHTSTTVTKIIMIRSL